MLLLKLIFSASHTFGYKENWTLQATVQLRLSHGHRSVGLSGPVAYNVFQLPGVGDVIAGLVLGEDLHQGTQLQPPLLFRDPVTTDRQRTLNIELANQNVIFISDGHMNARLYICQ